MNLFKDEIFNNNLLYMKSLIGKTVQIDTIDGNSHKGIVFVIDPVYKTVVLHIKSSSSTKDDTLFIMYHAIRTLNILPNEIKESYLHRLTPVHDPNMVSLQRKRLKKWLEQMHISVNEFGGYLKIDEELLIMPPYDMDSCICNNTIILEKITNIISLMPQDFN